MTEKQNNKETKSRVRLRDVMSFSWSYWKHFPWRIGLTFFSVALSISVDLVYPYFSSMMVDAVARGYAGEADQIDRAFYAIIIMFSLMVAGYAFRTGGYYLWCQMSCSCLAKIVQDALFKVQRFSTDWHANSFAGATVRKITRGVWAFDGFGDTLILSLLPAVMIVIGMTIVQAFHWPLMGLIFAIGFVFYTVASILLTVHYAAPAHRAFNKSDSELGGSLADSVTCNTVVKTFGAENREDQRIGRQSQIWRSLIQRSWYRMVDVDQVQSLLMSLMVMTIMIAAVWRWAIGLFTPGDVGYVMTGYYIVRAYIQDIGRQIRQLQKAVNELEDVVLFSKMPLDIADKENAETLKVSKAEIKFDHVTFSYSRNIAPVYQDFSIVIKPGERVALVGRSGSGKSTFVKLIQRLYDIDTGAIEIDGQDVSEVTQQSLRQAIALVPQEPTLFHRTLAENVAYATPDASMEDIIRASKLAHAHEFVEKLEDGYQTMVGERGIKLSGGERQRVAIARAILADKPILILDEATSSLDSISEQLIQDAIDNLMEGRTTIMVAHRLSTIKKVDRILVFDQGKIVEQGTHSELLLKEEGYYKSLFEMQSFGLIGETQKTA